ncbi:FliA/WhiG family RNA polymerase sigma factor [Desulfomicrobium sp. ZS1]|uniref:FliA/WhiG family RNA polymerase sigma factor n=1 Tax=Desulfomicrobium sp. ZS1 TaxID=2952228 RepID=UPI0020B3796A|nr:FliA/WhiG family RNA polymerase sigma factor [Desulfomicrobium sp. ZS1]UTF50278.1 FliA/WhiG family RNA polymerase sigma factor [Desulfomicrobium sp. ZS1]
MGTSSSSGRSSSLRNNTAEPVWAVLEQTGITFASLCPSDKDCIARAFAPRIKIIALHLKAKLPAHIELSDLISAGTLGLMEALGKFQPELNIRFETFADSRIRGAMLDELRRMDWYSRGLRQRIKKLEQVIRGFEQENGHAPTRSELLELTGQDRQELEATLEAVNSQIILSLDAIQDQWNQPGDGGNHREPFAAVAFHDIIDKLGHLIDRLNEREKLVLSLYYTEEFNMKEVALALDITEGRVSQLHSQALGKLKKMFVREYGDIN